MVVVLKSGLVVAEVDLIAAMSSLLRQKHWNAAPSKIHCKRTSNLYALLLEANKLAGTTLDANTAHMV